MSSSLKKKEIIIHIHNHFSWRNFAIYFKRSINFIKLHRDISSVFEKKNCNLENSKCPSRKRVTMVNLIILNSKKYLTIKVLID